MNIISFVASSVMLSGTVFYIVKNKIQMYYFKKNRVLRNHKPPELIFENQKIIQHALVNEQPELSINVIQDKLIANNYGHGASSWALAPGACGYINDLMIESSNIYNMSINAHTEISIVGADIIGLYTAYSLYKKGYKNINILAEDFTESILDGAEGILAPAPLPSQNDTTYEKVYHLGIESYNEYIAIALDIHPDLSGDCAKILPAYFPTVKASRLAGYSEIMQPKRVLLDFGNSVQHPMVAYDDVVFINKYRLMHELKNYLQEHGISFSQQHVTNITNINTPIVFNTAGIGSLSNTNIQDNKNIIQEYFVTLMGQNYLESAQYVVMINSNTKKSKNRDIAKKSFYYIPQSEGVISARIEKTTTEKPNEDYFDDIKQASRQFFYGSQLHKVNRFDFFRRELSAIDKENQEQSMQKTIVNHSLFAHTQKGINTVLWYIKDNLKKNNLSNNSHSHI